MAKTTLVVHTDGRRYRWKSWLHPRDRKGQFIETFAEVRTIAGMLGRVMGRGARNGTVRVRRHQDRKEFDIPSNMLEVLRRPGGKRPTPKQGPDVGELRSTRTKTPASPRGMRGAQNNETLAEWDSGGLRNHLAKMFRDNGDDLDDRYALGVAQWALFKDGRDRDDVAEIDRVIDDAREAAGLRRTPGDDYVQELMAQDVDEDDVTDFRVTQLEPKGDVEVGALVEESRVTPMRVADMPASAQEKLQAFVDNYGIDTKAIEDEFYEALQNEEYRRFGAIWYREEMQATAKRIAEATRGMKHPVSWQDALALVAIFSARNTWEGKNGNRWNEIHATRLAMAFASGAFDGLTARQVMDRADPKVTDRDSPDFWEFGYIRDKGFGLNGAALLLGEMNRDEALGKAKRKSFYSNGLEPDSNEDVTIDVWMANPLARYSTSNRTIQQWQSALSSGDPPKYLADLGIDASPVYMLMAEIVRRAHERGVADGLWDEGSVPSYTQAAAWIQQQVFERRGT